MTHEQALAYWYGRINYEQSPPRPDDLRLERMRRLLALLSNPEQRFRIIHVAGSKGKGSTSAMLAAILRRAGYRTGLFTSPHLCRVEERMQVDGTNVSSDELTALIDDVQHWEPRLRRMLPPGDPGPTFFEVATAVGFLHFARRRVDVALIEVGLGGRFDSTNVCRPLVSLITSISHDHTQVLGDRLASIAREKAGIIKPGRPVISGATAGEARQVIAQVARERGARLRQLTSDFRYGYEPGRITSDGDRPPRVRVVTQQRSWPTMELGLWGEHQAANAAVAVACVEELRHEGLTIGDQPVALGLATVQWPARLEVLGRRPLVVLDCAHNVASAQALVDTLLASFPLGRRLLIFAVSSDKDVPGILRVLAPHFAHAFLTRYTSGSRSLLPEQAAELLQHDTKMPFTICATPAEAWHAAKEAARPEDLICATGSVFLAGELRPLLT